MQPCEDQGHCEDGEAHPTVRRLEVHRLLGIHQPFHQSAGREGSSPVPTHEENHSLRVERQDGRGLSLVEEDADYSACLVAPTAKEPMLVYIAATSRVVSTVIVVEHKEEGKALPV